MGAQPDLADHGLVQGPGAPRARVVRWAGGGRGGDVPHRQLRVGDDGRPCGAAPVLSQPSLPFPLRSGTADLNLSPADLARSRPRAPSHDLCVLGLRFTGDNAVPAVRFGRLQEELGDSFVGVEIDSSTGNTYGIRKPPTRCSPRTWSTSPAIPPTTP